MDAGEVAVLGSAAGLDGVVLSALGLQAPATTALRAYLLEVLSTWRAALLIVDNCEHLLRAIARLVHAVLADAPNVSVLATQAGNRCTCQRRR